jgi:hypothetical protein
MALISNQRRQLGLHSFVKSFPPLRSTKMSSTLGLDNLESARAFPMSWVIGSGVDLTKFADEDYRYVPNFDVIFVQKTSRLYTWLVLKL